MNVDFLASNVVIGSLIKKNPDLGLLVGKEE